MEGTTGFLVQPRHIDSLAAAMAGMMNLSDSERNAMGEAGRTHARERFDVESILDQWETLYSELMGRSA